MPSGGWNSPKWHTPPGPGRDKKKKKNTTKHYGAFDDVMRRIMKTAGKGASAPIKLGLNYNPVTRGTAAGLGAAVHLAKHSGKNQSGFDREIAKAKANRGKRPVSSGNATRIHKNPTGSGNLINMKNKDYQRAAFRKVVKEHPEGIDFKYLRSQDKTWEPKQKMKRKLKSMF